MELTILLSWTAFIGGVLLITITLRRLKSISNIITLSFDFLADNFEDWFYTRPTPISCATGEGFKEKNTCSHSSLSFCLLSEWKKKFNHPSNIKL